MTSTELALALNIDKRTPGCWGCSRCGLKDIASDCGYCKQPPVCLWPLPDSGEPGAELFTSALAQAMRARIDSIWVDSGGWWHVVVERNDFYAATLHEALYAAWLAQETANG